MSDRLRWAWSLSAALSASTAHAQVEAEAPAAPAASPPPAPEASAAPPPAAAAAPPAPAKAAPSPPTDGHKGKKNKDKDDPAEGSGLVFTSAGGSLKLKGRVLAMVELAHRSGTVVGSSGALEERTVNSLDLSLESARIAVEYRSPLRWLSAELELELAGKPKVKDAYLLAGKRFFVQAGQFKVPSPAMELESPWDLPLARRGLMHDLLTDWLDVAGRRPGVALGYRGRGKLKPRLTLGAFQGTTLESLAPGERDVVLIDHAALDAQTYAARAEMSLFGVKLGGWFEQRVGSKSAGEFEHYTTLGLDATLDATFSNGGLRAWLDGSAGQSWYVHDAKPDQEKEPLFVLGRALVAYRFGGLALGDPYLEPFGFFGLLDPDTEVVSDFGSEVALGVSAGFWDRARLTLQAERTSGQRNFPSDYLDGQDPDRSSLLLMAGARF